MNIKSTVLSLFLLVVCYVSYSQEVVSPAGAHHQSQAMSISWTLGEAVIETFVSGEYILTQGMHQGELLVTSIHEHEMISVNVFPNPVTNVLHIELANDFMDGELTMQLFDISGKLIDSQKISHPETLYPFQKYKPGVYMLSITLESGERQTFRIVKK